MTPRSVMPKRPARLLAALLVLSLPAQVHAQSIMDRLKQKAADKKAAVSDSIADAATSAAVDKATGAVQCLVTDIKCIKKAFDSGKHVKLADADGDSVSTADSAKAIKKAGGVPASLPPAPTPTPPPADASAPTPGVAPPAAFGEGVFVNYDFVPGDRVIFAEDFARDQVGDFPKRLNLRQGNFEVADWQSQRFLRATSTGTIAIPLPERLPDRFTFEADFSVGSGWGLTVHFVDPDSEDMTHATLSTTNGGLDGTGVNSSTDLPENAIRPLAHVAVMAAGKYAKVYINGVRVANVPDAKLGRGHVIVLELMAEPSSPAYLSNIRVAEGGKPLYDALMADGHVATHGILFATGSDQIRGESKPTLDAIGQMLQAHTDLKLSIEGHTDNVGSAPSNQTLSEKRAAAVRQFLVTNYQIDASRLTSKGLGSTKPAAPNTTAEGRQQNRRVELVKM